MGSPIFSSQLTALLRWLALFAIIVHTSACHSEPKSIGKSLEISSYYGVGDQYQNIRLLGALSLKGSDDLAELSDLAWDEDEELLYAVSDQGRLLHLRPIIKNNQLRDIQLINTFPLKDDKGKKFKDKYSDAEGLNLLNGHNGIREDSELLISFEQKHRVLRVTPEGKEIEEIPLPDPLNNKKSYRKKNDGIEGFVIHPKLGALYAAEKPLDGDDHFRLISENNLHWFLPVLEEEGGIVAMENHHAGGIIVMERAVTTVIKPWTITLYRIHPTEENRGELLKPDILARLNSAEDWYVQNMEGLTHYKDRRYFMVSDDGDSIWQSTQLLLFEITD